MFDKTAAMVFALLLLVALHQVQWTTAAVASSSQGLSTRQHENQLTKAHAIRTTSTGVQAVSGGTALLPCDLTTSTPEDAVQLVVWYKDQKPIYSYDTRDKRGEQGKHWHDAHALNDRAYFRTITQPATLSLDNVVDTDQGDYHCRIDFVSSPTRNNLVTLAVIVPPQKPTIFDINGKEVPSVAGPYVEGGDLKLTCMVSGGRPEPTVRWWRDGRLLESADRRTPFHNVRTNELELRGLKRADHHAVFTCQASNNNITQPAAASVTLEMHFKPLSVEILSSNQPFSADRKYEIPCQSVGSRPPARISWWLDNLQKFEHKQEDSADGNVSTSTLNLTPTRVDNGRTLTCRAENSHVLAGVEEASIKLNVYFVPILNLALGPSLNPEDIEEGDDVYFDCKIHANPSVYKVIWKHNGQVIQHNQKAGVIISHQALALQNVGKQQAGNYTCIASNVEGDGDSNAVELKIMYKPMCRAEQKRVYGVARHENAQVQCEVESYPPPDSFKWSFNNTAETIDVPQGRYKSTSVLSMSTLSYTPVSEMDYGTVMCWATNLAGRQNEPCVFHIIAAGKPDSPFNCTLLNQTAESLEVECIEGFDGGQPQYFLLEVFDQETGILQANVSAKFPLFAISGLAPGRLLRMRIYSANGKGRSEYVGMEAFTLKRAEKQTGTPTQLELTPALATLIGAVAALFLVSCLIAMVMRMRMRRQQREARRQGKQLVVGAPPLKDKATIPLRTEPLELYEKDDKNPDVIPSNKGSDYQMTSSGAQTPGVNHAEQLQRPPSTHHGLADMATVNRFNPPQQITTNGEVTYAELCLAARPQTLATVTAPNGPKSDATIYAQIDHTRRPPPPPPTVSSPLVTPPNGGKQGLYLHHPHREVVTVRTPLMGCQQESCV